MQFRRIIPDVNLDELKEIFTGRKAYIKKVLNKANSMVECGCIESKAPMKMA